MDRKTISIIKQALRRASLKNPSRNEVKKRAKVGPSLFRCECGCDKTLMYEGSSEKNLKEIKKEFKKFTVIKERGNAHHIDPVREGKGQLDWTDYINSLFCPPEKLLYLSTDCHKRIHEKDS